MLQTSLHLRVSGRFQYQCKNVKNEDFGICSISPTEMILKVLYLFLICYIVLWQYAVILDSKNRPINVQNRFLRVFTLSKK